MELKQALRELMNASGKTQVAIQDVTGINQGRISRIINPNRKDRPTLTEILEIEAACGEEPGFVLAAAGLTTLPGTRRGANVRSAGARKGTGPSS